MNFYRRRPLALIVSMCILVSAAVYFVPGAVKLILLALLALLTPVTVIILRRRRTADICGLKPTPFAVITAALMMAIVLISYAYMDVYVARFENTERGTLIATVISVENRTPFSAVYAVRLESLDGKPSGAKGLLNTDTAISLGVGDMLAADVNFSRLDEFYAWRDCPRVELLADGYAFACTASDDIRLAGRSGSFEVRLAELRETFAARMSLYLDRDSSALADALLLGDRSGLGRISRDFTYIGVIHLLALSGLHLAVIGGGFEKLLMYLHVGRRTRYILTCLFIMFYAALTGFLMSVMRAAGMLVLAYAASLLDTDSDRVNSLFISVGLIVLVSPAAVFDVSLQMSFAATLGVLLISEAAKHHTDQKLSDGKAHPILGRLLSLARNIAAAFGAVIFLLPLQWLYFGEVSLMSVIATLIMSIFCEALLIMLPIFLACALVNLHFICGMLGGIIRALSQLCAALAAWLAEDAVLLSLRYPFALPIMIITAAVIIYMIVRDYPSWLYALIPFAVASVVYIGLAFAWGFMYGGRISVDFAGYGMNDTLTVVSEGKAAVVDIGEGSPHTMYLAMDAAASQCITEIDTLLLTDIHRGHVGSVRTLLAKRKVGRIFLPSPHDEYEMYIISEIISVADEYGTEAVMYDLSQDTAIDFGGVSLTLPAQVFLKRSARPLKAVSIAYGEEKLVYVGASAWENEDVWSFTEDAEYLIFGMNGPLIKASPGGTVPDTTRVICAANDEISDALMPWLDGYDGVLLTESRFCVTIDAEKVSNIFEN